MRRLRSLDWGLVFVGAPVLMLAILGWSRRWSSDDAFINFRVVDNLFDGLGPVFNAGERVEAYTSPLWLGMLAAGHGVTGEASLPWLAVLLGLGLSLLGLAAACLGSLMLWRSFDRGGFPLPLGALVFVALPPVWDFATSGLETGLSFAWLGVSFLALVALCTDRARLGRFRVGPALVAVLVGLGPLVRPDLALFTVGFLVVLLTHERRWRLLIWALALPVAYQVFRMGYFAALVPNTAFAKEASESFWGRGWDYLRDFVDPYVLFLPLAALAVLVVLELRAVRPRLLSARGLLVLVPVVGGLLSTLYVIRVGGDFMHGRLFLPGLFGLLLPAMVVAPAWRLVTTAAACVTAVWVVVAATGLRYDTGRDPLEVERFADEREFYESFSMNDDPVTLGDYERAPWVVDGTRLRFVQQPVVELHPPTQRFGGDDPPYPDPPSRPGLPNDVVAAFYAVGLVSFTAGTDVTIVDRIGLGDMLAARLRFRPIVLPGGEVREERYRPGHEKALPLPWVVARYADFDSPAGRELARDPQVAAARRALECGDLKELREATSEPMSFGRFLSNMGDAFALHNVRFDPEPEAVVQDECAD